MPSLWCDPPAHQDLTHRFIRFQDLYHNIYIYYSSICCKRGGTPRASPKLLTARGTRPAISYPAGRPVCVEFGRPPNFSKTSQHIPTHYYTWKNWEDSQIPNMSSPRLLRQPRALRDCHWPRHAGRWDTKAPGLCDCKVLHPKRGKNPWNQRTTGPQQDLNIPQSQSWKVDFWIHFLSLLICDELQHCTTHLVQVRRKLLFFALDQHLTIPSGQFYRDIVLWRTPCPGWLLLW